MIAARSSDSRFAPGKTLQPAAIRYWPVLAAAVAACALGVTAAAAAEPSSAFDDPFDDALLEGTPPPKPPKPSQSPRFARLASRFASGADEAMNDPTPPRPRWRPLSKVFQEVGWMTPAHAPPPRLLSVEDAPAQPSLVDPTDLPAAEWHGSTLVTPPVQKNIWLAYPTYVEKFAGAFLSDEPIEGQLK